MKKITIKNKILILLSFVFIFISSFVVSTFAYHDDSNGNLVSDNLQPVNDKASSSIGGVAWYISEQTLYLNGTSSSGSWQNITTNSFTLEAGTYTIQWFTNYTGNNIGFGAYNNSTGLDNLYQLNTNRYKTFTISEETTFTIVCWWQSSGLVFDNIYVKSMIYSGSYDSSKQFELYGSIYYSSSNYNESYDSGYNEGLNNAFKSVLHYENLSSCYLQYTSTYNGTRYLGIVYNGQLCSSDVGNRELLWSDADYEYPISSHWEENISTNYGLFYNTNWTIYNFIQEVANYPAINADITSSMVFDFITPITLDSTGFTASGWRKVRFVDNYGVSTDYDMDSGPLNISVRNIVRIVTFGLADFADDSYYLVSDPLGSYYFKGFTDGLNDAQVKYDLDVSKLESQIISLQNTITTLNNQITLMQNSEKNYQHLLWTVAGTPWESFNKIWNVEFGGINIANIVTGFITALLVIYIIKKIWK